MEFFKKLLNSFRYAANGIFFCINHETNIRIHIVATICVLFLSAFYEFTKEQYILLILTCLVVICTEMINTAIEVVIDKNQPRPSFRDFVTFNFQTQGIMADQNNLLYKNPCIN